MLSFQLSRHLCTVGPNWLHHWNEIQRMTEFVLPSVLKSSRQRKSTRRHNKFTNSEETLQPNYKLPLNDRQMTLPLFSLLIVRCIAQLQKEVCNLYST